MEYCHDDNVERKSEHRGVNANSSQMDPVNSRWCFVLVCPDPWCLGIQPVEIQ